MPDLLGILRQSFGSLAALLDDPAMVEISANADGRVFAERAGSTPTYAGDLSARAREQIIRTCATASGVPATAEAPIVSARMPGCGYRFEGLIPPAVEVATFSIRLHGAEVRSLDSYVASGTMRQDQVNVLRAALQERRNVIVSGGTSSGKTTLLNSLLRELGSLAPSERLVVIEDTPELRTSQDNTVFLRATGAADATRLLASTLRLRPDRIIVGEVRDGAALALLKAWNTGHPGGLASLHANSARDALVRLDLLVREASAAPLPEVIGSAVDLVVFVERTRAGRQLREIIAVKGYANGKFETELVA